MQGITEVRDVAWQPDVILVDLLAFATQLARQDAYVKVLVLLCTTLGSLRHCAAP